MALTKAQIVDSVNDQIGFTKNHSFEIIVVSTAVITKYFLSKFTDKIY